MTEAKFWHHSLLALVYNGFLQFLKVSADFGNICMVRANHREPILSLPLPIANDMDKKPIIELTHTSVFGRVLGALLHWRFVLGYGLMV